MAQMLFTNQDKACVQFSTNKGEYFQTAANRSKHGTDVFTKSEWSFVKIRSNRVIIGLFSNQSECLKSQMLQSLLRVRFLPIPPY